MQISIHKAKNKEQVANLGARAVAFCLDALLLMLTIGIIEYFTVSSDEQAWLFKGERLLHLLLGWLYFAGLESSSWQATIGKQLLELRVTSETKDRISFACASLRYALRPIGIFIYLLRYITNSLSPYTQLFHDKVAGTQVLKTPTD
ncbi:RDD family protein [Pontibacter sp. JH31]|uniref:RDD family protein n=2 Tax=Pontibacter aquaedesilientis TaxID=2766980 RepID=A0ABR7XF60_9BACT|nr:RDD family protein [Pontibacter aquaedesilientis]